MCFFNSQEFEATYVIPQAAEKSFDFNKWIGSLTSRMQQPESAEAKMTTGKDQKAKRKTLINGKLRDVVEMAYWLVKFVGDYEKLSSKSYQKDLRLPKEGEKNDTLISGATRNVIAFSRYFLKYLGSFEKLFYAANKA